MAPSLLVSHLKVCSSIIPGLFLTVFVSTKLSKLLLSNDLFYICQNVTIVKIKAMFGPRVSFWDRRTGVPAILSNLHHFFWSLHLQNCLSVYYLTLLLKFGQTALFLRLKRFLLGRVILGQENRYVCCSLKSLSFLTFLASTELPKRLLFNAIFEFAQSSAVPAIKAIFSF